VQKSTDSGFPELGLVSKTMSQQYLLVKRLPLRFTSTFWFSVSLIKTTEAVSALIFLGCPSHELKVMEMIVIKKKL
jgi:hypothetical protein